MDPSDPPWSIGHAPELLTLLAFWRNQGCRESAPDSCPPPVSFPPPNGPQTRAAGRANADIGRFAVGFGAEPLGLADDGGAVAERMTLPHCGFEREPRVWWSPTTTTATVSVRSGRTYGLTSCRAGLSRFTRGYLIP